MMCEDNLQYLKRLINTMPPFFNTGRHKKDHDEKELKKLIFLIREFQAVAMKNTQKEMFSTQLVELAKHEIDWNLLLMLCSEVTGSGVLLQKSELSERSFDVIFYGLGHRSEIAKILFIELKDRLRLATYRHLRKNLEVERCQSTPFSLLRKQMKHKFCVQWVGQLWIEMSPLKLHCNEIHHMNDWKVEFYGHSVVGFYIGDQNNDKAIINVR
ncbi:DUF7168 domain-containing protein [Xenorhabdus griffiniae]|uniref:Uncharacterized protein n=1 Tax=Xenorhabdus griffiniae TaxID=351672 RepID=A0ABY9XF47_9GAMM|nr:hypothetical protein [Xenorhabdus griffiniae]MBD1225965.1 hypothetical protein [Xenorhabdus griffiniae]MBE8585917.1 hypothetical protein [Xenorhabdus griffiniae]WMV71457.1 hypothetical protein QL128_14975 [Xenorhabdus griffiniae]WNH01134.1 hypothetical protein QL112_014980 [Xenorhabdus griffiniae]